MRIAVDAMGGDHAPEEVIKGAVQAAKNYPDIEVLLVGMKGVIEETLAKSGGGNVPNLRVYNASQAIAMNDSPVEAFRSKPDSSITVAANLVKTREADAIVSAGNTGAVVVAATFMLGLLEGVRRAGIAVPMPTKKGTCFLMDAGGNIHCKPPHLLQYGIMASIYAKYIGNVSNPSIGLLNIGEEEEKGNLLVKQTLELFKKSQLNFYGNVEGQDIYRGTCDVVVCEGFIGNVLLKVTEGVGELLISTLVGGMKAAGMDISNGGNNDAPPNPFMQAFAKMKAKLDYSEYGGAPLMGVNGVCIICHGRSKSKAITNAIRVAGELTKHKANNEIVELIRKTEQLIESVKKNGE
ncbi:MAG: phosphate acyltransferase PlsX [Planctomycetes bacterium]|nr:phosphate acyltransferase PlsX [Planctomycetota bacterium]